VAQTPSLLPATVAAVLTAPHDDEAVVADRTSLRRTIVAQRDGGLMLARVHRSSFVVGLIC
jgi:hypothetical protein